MPRIPRRLKRLLYRGQKAERPKYVETVGRRGYRFIGTINEQMATARRHVSGPARAGERLAQTKADRKSLALFIGFAVIAIATTYGIYLASNRSHSHAAGKTINSVAVLPFEMATANPQTLWPTVSPRVPSITSQ